MIKIARATGYMVKETRTMMTGDLGNLEVMGDVEWPPANPLSMSSSWGLMQTSRKAMLALLTDFL